MPSESRRTIVVVTGTRAEYGILRTVIAAIQAHPRLRLRLVVTGMHLLRKFGNTVNEIRRDGWKIDARVPMQSEADHPAEQAAGMGRGIAGLARVFKRLEPTFVVVLGDRIEAFAAAAATVMSRRLLAHIHGGDVAAGDIDDTLRHAISKLAHVHLPATRDAAERIRRLGEDRWRIHQTGAPGLDELRELLDRTETKSLNLLDYAANEDFAIVVRHPCSRSAPTERQQMENLLGAVRAEGLASVVLYPNSDPGNSGIIRAIQRARHHPSVRVYPSLPRPVYLSLLRRARILVGNSSSGIIEAAFLGTPAVNVGQRQAGRLRASRCILDASENVASIRRAIRAARRMRPRPGARTAYGDGRAGKRIAKVLATVKLTERLAFKRITY